MTTTWTPTAPSACLLTFDELLTLIVALPGFSFMDWEYSPEGDHRWSSTAFFDEPDRSFWGEANTKEDAMFLLFVAAISGGIRRYHD